MKISFLPLLPFIVVALVSSCQRQTSAEAESPPNIVIIMADDMGFSDIGCYGGEIKTPNIDRLAENGLRFTQFYNTSRCCPSRAALLTGLYPHKAGMGWMTSADLGAPGYRGQLNDHCTTIAEVLKSAGYASYMSGKWHLIPRKAMEPDGPKDNWPLQRGFSRFFGTLNGAGSFFETPFLTSGNTRIETPEAFYYTDAISDTAAQYIAEHPAGQPFFLYVSYTAPHWPLHAWPEDYEPYLGQYRKGWDQIRKERFARLSDMGIIQPQWALSPREAEVPAWDSIPEEEKELWDKRMAIYAAQITVMDEGIGRIVESLKTKGVLENSLIFFLADNGGCAENISRKDTTLAALGSEASFESYRIHWANASNTPFREYKHWVHEGGIASPLVVHWPAGIKTGNQLLREPCHIIDLMATCIEAAGADYPESADGQTIYTYQGKSLLPAIRGEDFSRGPLFWEHEANRAIRNGKWKLVSKGYQQERPFVWELYDMEADRPELHDLSNKYPDTVQAMSTAWEQWAEDNFVYPLHNEGWGERVK